MQHLNEETLNLMRFHSLNTLREQPLYTGEAVTRIQANLTDVEDIYIKRLLRYMRWVGLLEMRGTTSNALYRITEAGIVVLPVFQAALPDDE